MPIEGLEGLLSDPEMREALRVVFERSDGGDDELQWQDVSDALSSGQWGRLIQEDILVSAGAGFRIADPETLEQRLNDEPVTTDETTTDPPDEIEPATWTGYDKAAGIFTLIFAAGYWHAGIRETVASFDNLVLAPVTDLLPFYFVIIVLAIVTGLYSTLIQARLMDSEKLAAYRERMRDLKERRDAAKERGDEEALEEIKEEQVEAASDQFGMLKVQFRPMVYIMLLTIPVFLWLRWKVRGGHLGAGETGIVVPFAGTVTWQESLLGPMSTWIVWYLLCSVAARQLIRKVGNFQTSPS